MKMLWEELTSENFAKAVQETGGVCVLPIGVIEKHGQHLPLGTDMYAVRNLAERITAIEPALVFPYYFFGQINEAGHVPGTIVMNKDLVLKMLEDMCDEISRNGLKKIVILDGHGGNKFMLRYFMQTLLYKKKDYAVYLLTGEDDARDRYNMAELLKGGAFGGHAGNYETSIMLALVEELVKMDRVDEAGSDSYGRLDHLGDVYTAIGWYAKHPTHQAGDPGKASKEAGEAIIEIIVKIFAKQLKLVKEDTSALQLQNEFYEKCTAPK